MSAIPNPAENPQSTGLESYKHKFAKQLLVGWLRDAATEAGYDQSVQIFGLSWRVNRSAPTWGVYEEYPISRSVRCSRHIAAWDETGWGKVPTYEELTSKGEFPEAILDVAILHKGNVAYGFEVVHTNAVGDRKSNLLNTLICPVLEIEAEWILRQVRCPNALKILQKHGRGMPSLDQNSQPFSVGGRA